MSLLMRLQSQTRILSIKTQNLTCRALEGCTSGRSNHPFSLLGRSVKTNFLSYTYLRILYLPTAMHFSSHNFLAQKFLLPLTLFLLYDFSCRSLEPEPFVIHKSKGIYMKKSSSHSRLTFSEISMLRKSTYTCSFCFSLAVRRRPSEYGPPIPFPFSPL